MFFSFNYFPSEIVKVIFSLFMFSCLIKKKNIIIKGTPKIIVYYTFCVLLSCFVGFFFNDQPLISIFNRSYYYFTLASFFVPMFFSLSAKDTEDVFISICKLYCICYFVQWLVYPILLFSGAELNADVDSGIYRVRITGSICAYYLFFHSLCKLSCRFHYKNVVTLLLSSFPIVMMGFRTLIALTLIGSFMLLYNVIKNKFHLILCCLSFMFFLFYSVNSIPIVNHKWNEMMERQNTDQTFTNDDYIRIMRCR